MSSTASSAERPDHGWPAACAALPRKENSRLTSALAACEPHAVERFPETCEKSATSTSLNRPSRMRYALPPTSSSAVPGQMTSVPGSFSRSMSFFTASAPVMFTACPELCPSPCPGAPSTSGAR